MYARQTIGYTSNTTTALAYWIDTGVLFTSLRRVLVVSQSDAAAFRCSRRFVINRLEYSTLGLEVGLDFGRSSESAAQTQTQCKYNLYKKSSISRCPFKCV